MLTATNANNVATGLNYDDFGRLIRVIEPGDTLLKPTSWYTYTDDYTISSEQPGRVRRTARGRRGVLATDASGAEVSGSRTRYLPFGDTRGTAATGSPTDFAFTGMRQLGVGLVHMGARMYDAYQNPPFPEPKDIEHWRLATDPKAAKAVVDYFALDVTPNYGPIGGSGR